MTPQKYLSKVRYQSVIRFNISIRLSWKCLLGCVNTILELNTENNDATISVGVYRPSFPRPPWPRGLVPAQHAGLVEQAVHLESPLAGQARAVPGRLFQIGC